MKNRDVSIDVMKGMLVVLMVIAHIIQFFPISDFANLISDYVNLTTFSGFMFTFGYVCYKAYICKDIDRLALRKKLCKNVVKTLIAFYISGICFTMLYERDLSVYTMLKILLLWKIPGYSEFLLSFMLIYIVVYLFKNKLNRLSNTEYAFFFCLSLLMTFINYDAIKIPLVGILIGSTKFACFPIVQYASYFLAGMYLADKNKVYDKFVIIISVAGSAIFVAYRIYYGVYPSRFPPSMIWVVGGYLFILCYFLICKRYGDYLSKLLLHIVGRNTLIYLVISNIFIFSMYRLDVFEFENLSKAGKLVFYVFCFGACMLLSHLYCKFLECIIESKS